MSYLRYLLGTAFLLLALTAALNAFVDPGAIYLHASANPDSYVRELVAAPHGLWWPNNSYSDRQVKKALVRFAAGKDCVVIGSSRVMQAGSDRADRILRGECASILNLAVSSGGIEDEIALAWLAARNKPPRKIVLGIDPWTFFFNSTQRWTYYAQDFFAAAHDIGALVQQPTQTRESGALFSRFGNLFNLEYTLRSFSQLQDEIMYGGDRFVPRAAPPVNPATGSRYPVLLPDGSLIYSADYIAGKGVTPVPIGGKPYADREASIDPAAVAAYAKLLDWLKHRGVQPILLLTPFHPNVLAARSAKNVRQILETEGLIRALAKQRRVQVIGTFDPAAAHCPAAEFYDFMHTSTRCQAGLDSISR